MRVLLRFLFPLATLVYATQAFCEDEQPFRWHVNAGYSLTQDTTARYLNDGWIFGGGVTWNPMPGGPFALRLDLDYSSYNATREFIQLAGAQSGGVRIDDGYGSIWGLNVNGVYTIPFSSGIRGYLTAGIGENYRRVRMTQTALVSGIVCDPWWGYCYEGVGQGDVIVAERSTTRLGWNAGLGVESTTLSARGVVFIEARYRHIDTSEPTVFIPIQIGYRF